MCPPPVLTTSATRSSTASLARFFRVPDPHRPGRPAPCAHEFGSPLHEFGHPLREFGRLPPPVTARATRPSLAKIGPRKELECPYCPLKLGSLICRNFFSASMVRRGFGTLQVFFLLYISLIAPPPPLPSLRGPTVSR